MFSDQDSSPLFTILSEINSDEEIPDVLPLMVKEAEKKIKDEKIDKNVIYPEVRYLGDKLCLDIYRVK